jgi:hypothetical protein
MGPFEVLEVCGTSDLNRKLHLSPTLQETMKSNIFHVSKLKTAWERTRTFDVTTDVPPPTKEDHDGLKEYYVEKIVSYEDRRNGRYFRIKWEGYDSEYNTWEHESLLTNAQERVQEYFKGNPNAEAVNPSTKNRLKQKKEKQTIREGQRKSTRLNKTDEINTSIKQMCAMIRFI